MTNNLSDRLQCNECDHVFDRDDAYEYQIINNHVLDDDVPDSDAVCTKCGSSDVCDYEPIVIPFRDKVANFGIYLLRVAAVCAFAIAALGVFNLAAGVADDLAKAVGGGR